MTPTSDRQLWLVESPDHCLPVFADPFQFGNPALDYLLIQPALAYNRKQLETLEEFVGPHSCGKADDSSNRWWVLETIWKGVAKKAPGITPRFYLKWGDVEPLPPVEHGANPPAIDDGLNREEEKFARFITSKSAVLDHTQVKLTIGAIAKYGPEWLLDQRPIDLGFAVLYPLPLRANWKEALLALYPRLMPTMFRRPTEERDKWLEEHFIPELYDSKLCAINQEALWLYWRPECVPTRYWWEAVKKSENEKRKVLGPASYAKRYVRAIKKLVPTIVDKIFWPWLREIARPCAALDEQRRGGEQALVPWREGKQIVARAPKISLPPIVVSGEQLLTGPTTAPTMETSLSAGLREMPDILPQEPDVREAGEADGAPADRGNDTERVPVQLCAEGDGSEQRVLAENGDGREA